MRIRPVKTEDDYESALAEIEGLLDAAPGSPKGDRLDVLATLVEAYEAERYSIPLPDPIEAIFYHMESRGLKPKDLEQLIGGRVRVKEVLNRQRRLTIGMIRKLNAALGIPAELLIQPYRASPKRQPGRAAEVYPASRA